MTATTRTLPAAITALTLLFALGPSYRPHPLQAHVSAACEEAPEPGGERGVVIRSEIAEDARSCLTIKTSGGVRVVEVPEDVATACIPDRLDPAIYPVCGGP